MIDGMTKRKPADVLAQSRHVDLLMGPPHTPSCDMGEDCMCVASQPRGWLKVCPTCYSAECEESAWVNVNSGALNGVGLEGPTGTIICENCTDGDIGIDHLLTLCIGDQVEVRPTAPKEVGFVGPLVGKIVRFGWLGCDPDERDAEISMPDGTIGRGRFVPVRLIRMVEPADVAGRDGFGPESPG